VDGGWIEWGLAGDAANAVGAEETFHLGMLRIHYQACQMDWGNAVLRL
jgi:hypothetical protein